MKVFIETDARHDLKKMGQAERSIFGKHIDKIAENPYGRHMEHGLPFYSEKVGQGRIVYQVRGSVVYIIGCFTTHKEYKKWYKSYKS